MVAPNAASQCNHGVPQFDDDDEKQLYNEGFKELLKNVNKYMEKGSQSVGKKCADKLIKEYPHLVSMEMVHLLAATGTKMWLADNKRARLVVQALAEIIGKLEKELKGYSTMEHELNKSFNETTGVKEAPIGNLKKFFQARVPCKCLSPSGQQQDQQQHKVEQQMGTCSFEGCGERKPLARLLACAGCRSVTYCCVDCQRVDWPVHSQDCQRLCKARKAAEKIGTADEVTRPTTTGTAAIHKQHAGSEDDDTDDDKFDDDDDDGSLAPDDLQLDKLQEHDEEGSSDEEEETNNGGSANSLRFDDIMGQMDELLNQSAASFRGKSKKKSLSSPSSKDKKKSSSKMSKLYASTSLLPSHYELEKASKKSKSKPDRSSSLRKKTSSDSTSKLHFSASFSPRKKKGKAVVV